MNTFTTLVASYTNLFQREKRKYSELREDFKTFRGIRSFREIRVNTHHIFWVTTKVRCSSQKIYSTLRAYPR